MRVALGAPASVSPDAIRLAALPPFSLAIDAGLQLLGVSMALTAAVLSVRHAALAVTLSGIAIAMAWLALPLIRSADLIHTAGAALAVAAVFAVLSLLGRMAGIGRRAHRGSVDSGRRDPWVTALAAAGAIAVILGPHLDIVVGGAITAAIAGHIVVRRGAGVHVLPLLPLLAVPALLFVAWYMHAIAGPTGLALRDLPEGPFSTAAQAMLLPALALAAAGFFALWPLHAVTPGPAFALIGVALLVRLGVQVLPAGIDGWQTVAVPVGLIGLWGSALTRRPFHVASALAWMACFAPEGEGTAGAWWLAAAVLAIHGLAATALAERPMLRTVAGAAAAAAGSWGAVLALDGILRAEVVYGVAAWIGVGIAARVYISSAHNSEPFSGATHGIFSAPPPI